MTTSNSKIKLYERVTRLETQMAILSTQVTSLMENHLPHLQEKVDRLENRLVFFSGVLAAFQFLIGIGLAVYLK